MLGATRPGVERSLTKIETLATMATTGGLRVPIASEQPCAKSMICSVDSQDPFGNAILSVRAYKSWAPHCLSVSCAPVGATLWGPAAVCSDKSEQAAAKDPTLCSSNSSSEVPGVPSTPPSCEEP